MTTPCPRRRVLRWLASLALGLGLAAAAQYEAQAGLTGDATSRWSLTGGVLLAAAAIIVIGNLLAGLSRLRIRR